MNDRTPPAAKSGFVAIVGAPNVGKSTLLNKLLGQKLSITSKKPQTTRNRILGILNRTDAQIVFLDSPGIHPADKPLNVRIVDTALSVVADADLLLLLVDASKADPASEKILLHTLKKQKAPVLLALNKIDRIQKPALLEQMRNWADRFPFRAIIPISAKQGLQLEDLLASVIDSLPYGPRLFPEEDLTDLPVRFIAAEMIREKVFRLTGQEIPYAAAVTVDSFKQEKGGKLLHIQATIHVERNTQKGIVIGKQGTKLRQIGEAARKEIEEMMDTQVFLKLFVRVQKNWSKDTKALRRFGY